MEQSTQPSLKNPVAWLIALAVVAVGGIAAYASGLFSQAPATQPEDTMGNTDPKNGAAGTMPEGSEQRYADGTYVKTVTYTSPGGNEQFDLSLTFANNIITAANFTPKPVSQIGQVLQDKFKVDFLAEVVGKPVDQVSISVISGASLTSAAFTKALAEIKGEAQAAL